MAGNAISAAAASAEVPSEDHESGVNALPSGAQTASGAPWVQRPFDADALEAHAAEPGVSRTLAGVLAGRGVPAGEAHAFLNPSLKAGMPDPFILKGMEGAVARIKTAVIAGETIGVFGDYDVDGTSAASIIKLYCDAIGAACVVRLPDRITEGYGPSVEGFLDLRAQGAGPIVTVDCGANAHDAVNGAAAEGADIVIIDHHLMTDDGPDGACALVNPHQPGDNSGLGGLSAAGLAFLFVAALNRALRDAGAFSERPEPDLRGLLDLAALGLVCDVMPMTGLARIITAQGLKIMSARENGPGTPGLFALADAAGAKAPYGTYALGFQIGPRINAAGRIGHARQAFELMTTPDADRRAALAEELHLVNARRQEIEAEVQLEAEAAIADVAAGEKEEARAVIVVSGEGWHPGVVGIVAGRLKEKLSKPVVVIGVQGTSSDGADQTDGEAVVGKGSGRSITGVDLGAAFAAAREEGLLISGGGHEMAAGLTIDPAKIKVFSDFLNDRLAAAVRRAAARRTIKVDGVVDASAVSRAFADDTARAGPFGPENPEPVFVLKDMSVLSTKPVGAGHIAVTLLSPSGQTVRAIAFRAAGEPLGRLLSGAARLDVAGRIRADDWRGGDAAQLQITDAARV
ncbi:MAG: single-stranded-DNA-specific exonuclease RecJ [Pseudomonadota bacterium]